MTTPPTSSPAAHRDWRATAAACTTVLLWASAFVSIRSAGEAYSPGALALGRLLAGSLALGALLLVRREGLPPRAARPGIIWSGAPLVRALHGGAQLG
ncbi:drug/metabolite transporter (DMT)-like permease [Streptomyces sp. TE3672]